MPNGDDKNLNQNNNNGCFAFAGAVALLILVYQASYQKGYAGQVTVQFRAAEKEKIKFAEANTAQAQADAESNAAATARAAAAAGAAAMAPEVIGSETHYGIYRSGSVYFTNCDDTHAQGIYDITPSDEGYRSELDADDDGLACE